ncbi:hypothetical protein CEXT_196611 [Caerostris extrusa]|uniref:Uncharacterized protein n=1 Tax=Caerostris extrusa TaxID=172846 RepID=A0AAV4S9X0_CAEEX|nr:hypothetical protein CEXT_196611 [Caerostris extrusa]
MISRWSHGVTDAGFTYHRELPGAQCGILRPEILQTASFKSSSQQAMLYLHDSMNSTFITGCTQDWRLY